MALRRMRRISLSEAVGWRIHVNAGDGDEQRVTAVAGYLDGVRWTGAREGLSP